MQKKKIIFLLPLLLIVMSTAMAQVEPTITDVGDHFLPNEASMTCTDLNGNIYCLGGDNLQTELKLYNVTTGTYIPIANISYGTHPNIHGYNDRIYVTARTSNLMAISVNLTGGDKQSVNFTLSSSVEHYPLCDLRPETDEIWCVSLFDETVPYEEGVFKYDIGDGQWTFILNLTANEFIGERFGQCFFRDNDYLWCINSINSGYGNQGLTYTISSNNITELGQVLPLDIQADWSYCVWSEGIVYCWNADIYGNNSDIIQYYDPVSISYGTLATTFPIELSYMGCAEATTNNNYCIGGYSGIAYDYSMDIYSITFPEEPVPEEEDGLQPYNSTHVSSDLSGVVVDFMVEFGVQMVAMAGLVALVVLGIYMMRL